MADNQPLRQDRVVSLSEQEDEQCPATMGVLGIARGFILKNPVRQSFTQYGLRAVPGIMGIYFNY